MDDAIDQLDEILAGSTIHGAHHAEIDKTDDIVGQHKNVAGMRIGMKKTELENLL